MQDNFQMGLPTSGVRIGPSSGDWFGFDTADQDITITKLYQRFDELK